MRTYTEAETLTCVCGHSMIPNLSTEDNEGLAWYCLTLTCGDYSANEIEAEDLEALGVAPWLAKQLSKLIEELT